MYNNYDDILILQQLTVVAYSVVGCIDMVEYLRREDSCKQCSTRLQNIDFHRHVHFVVRTDILCYIIPNIIIAFVMSSKILQYMYFMHDDQHNRATSYTTMYNNFK